MVSRNFENSFYNLFKHFPAVGLIGPRQVGKTTFVKKIQAQISNCIYLDLESPNDLTKLADPEWFFLQNIDKTIIIDEIQQVLTLFPILRSVIDRDRRAGRFILLGSASPEFLAKSSETLTGRIAYLEISPITVLEINEPQKLWLKGGFPDAYLSDDQTSWWIWQANFLKSYIERDLVKMGMRLSALKINQLLYMLAGLNGNLLNINDLSKSIQIDQRTINTYLDILEQAFIIRRLQPWFINITKRMVKSPKIYIRDTGNLHYLSDIKDRVNLTRSAILGHSWEGFIIQQICSQLADNVKPYFYRTANGSELDLILVKGIKPIVSIEIKLSLNSKIGKGNTLAINDLGTEYNFLITTEGGDYTLKNNWQVANIVETMAHLTQLDLLKFVN